MLRNFPPPLRVVHLALFGCALILLDFLVFDVRTILLLLHHVPLDGWRTRCVLLLPCLLGLVLILRYQGVLKKGIAREVWTEEQLEVARQWVNQRWIFWLQMGGVLLLVGIDCWRGNLRSSGFEGFTEFGLISAIVNPLASMKLALRKTLPRVEPINFKDVKPLQSDHWGQPPASA